MGHYKRKIAFGGLLIVVCSLCFADGDGFGFKSADAKRAEAKYIYEMKQAATKRDREITAADNDYSRTEKIARTKLLSDLEDAMSGATKSGQLDEAVLIRDAIATLKKDDASSGPQGATGKVTTYPKELASLREALIGTTWTYYTDGSERLTFKADGTAVLRNGSKRGTWTPVEDNRVYFNNGVSFIILEFDEGFATMKEFIGPQAKSKPSLTHKRVR